METQKTDRRVQRTRQALCQALIELTVEHGYDVLTVQEITARAGVARTTFYLHFADKDDLLFSGFRHLIDDLRASVQPGQMNASADWEHVAAHADFYRAMLGPQGSAAFVDFIRLMLAESMRDQLLEPLADGVAPRLDVGFVAHYLAGAQLGIYLWWLESGMQMPIEEISQSGQDLAVNGLLWGLGAAGSALEAPG